MEVYESKLAAALQCHREGKLQEAALLYSDIIKIDPNCDAALHYLGLIYFQAEKFDFAIAYISKAIEIKPASDRYADLAEVHLRLNESYEASICYKKALEINPNDANVYFKLALLFWHENLIQETLECCRVSLQLNPDNAEAHYILAHILLNNEDYGNAAYHYQESLSLKPDNYSAYHNLGLAYQKINKIDEAITCHQKAIELKPDHVEAYANLSNLFYLMNNQQKALQYCNKAVEFNPDTAEKHISGENSARYEIWKIRQSEQHQDSPPNDPDIKYALLYFYEGKLDKFTYEHFQSVLRGQTYKNYDIFPVQGISEELIDMFKSEYSYICFIEQEDLISAHALASITETLKHNKDLELIFTDEDVINEDNSSSNPYFKPEYAPFLLLSHNYMNALLCLKLNDKVINEFQKIKQINQHTIYRMILNLTRTGIRSKRISDILYHRSCKNSEKLNNLSTKEIILKEIANRNYNAEILDYDIEGLNQLKFYNNEFPKVSIIIPFKDKISLVEACVNSIEAKSSYKNYEIILVDNRSIEQVSFDYLSRTKHKVIKADFDFNFAKINNIAAEVASGEYLVFLNNDMEVISSDWIESMLGLACLPESGAIGAKLLYNNDTVQHAGMARPRFFFHANRCLGAFEGGYKNYNNLIREYSAMTGACLMISRQKFLDTGSFDEKLEVEKNDVDLCLRLQEAGYLNLYNPHAVLYHFESISRKGLFDERTSREHEYFALKWKDLIEKPDPYYNPNLSEVINSFAIKIN